MGLTNNNTVDNCTLIQSDYLFPEFIKHCTSAPDKN